MARGLVAAILIGGPGAIVLNGCPAQFGGGRGEQRPADGTRTDRFDLFGFPGDDSLVTADAPMAIEPVLDPVTEPVADTMTATRPRIYYRVQFFASQNIEAARRVAEKVTARINDPVDVSFETPYYKVRAGWFETPEDAERVLGRIKRLGYGTAWLVTDEAPVAADSTQGGDAAVIDSLSGGNR